MDLMCDCHNIKITVANPAQLTICNCAICSRYQALWGYYLPGDVQVTIGSLGIHNYLRGDREIEFIRCAHCGCVTHYQTRPGDCDSVIAVNFRMAKNSIDNIPIRYHNGKDI